jgi:hypothetical protein
VHFRTHLTAAAGPAIVAANDTDAALVPLEIRATPTLFAGGGVNIGGTTDPGAGALKLNPSGTNLGINIYHDALSGSLSGNGFSGHANLIDINSDNGTLTGDGNDNLGLNQFASSLAVQRSIGGSSMTGGRMGTFVYIDFTAPSSASNANRIYVGSQSSIQTRSGDNGGIGSYKGDFYSATLDTVALSGATYLNQLTGMEIDYEAQAGSSMRWKSGLIVNQKGLDAVQGTYDNAISICRAASLSGSTGAKVGIEFGYGDGGGDPIMTGGTLIKATSTSNPTVDTGINFYDYNVTGNLIQGKYSALGDYGGLFIGAGPSYTSTNVIAQGGQANIDIKIYPKGGGLVQVGNSGSFTTGTHSTIAKWLKVKDDAGTVYYMPVYQ